MDESSISVATPIVKEWLAEFKSLPESSISEYARGILDREELHDAVLKLFYTNLNSEDVMQPVCHQLFKFYRSGYVTFFVLLLSEFLLGTLIMYGNNVSWCIQRAELGEFHNQSFSFDDISSYCVCVCRKVNYTNRLQS